MNKEKNIYNFKAPKSSNEEVNFFNIKGRINRRVFFVRLLFVIAIYFLFLVLFNSGFHKNFGFRFENFYETIHIFIFPLIFSLFVLIQGAKRMHDINKSGWNFLIPFYNLYLAFLPGTKGNNDYGIDYNTAKNITYFDEVEGVDKSEITSRKVKSSRKKPNATDLPESKSNLKSYTYILIILVAVSAWYNTQKNKSTPPTNTTADSTSIDTTAIVKDSAAPANSFNESDILDTTANNEAEPLSDSEINLEDEFEDVPVVDDSNSKDVTFKNNSTRTAYLVYAFWNNSKWEIIGWYKMESNSSRTFTLPDTFYDNSIYWYAENSALGIKWEGVNGWFCINPTDRFHYFKSKSNEDCIEDRNFHKLTLTGLNTNQSFGD
jgi:uncharacterized membrane protein YhaH (DUF805 family)